MLRGPCMAEELRAWSAGCGARAADSSGTPTGARFAGAASVVGASPPPVTSVVMRSRSCRPSDVAVPASEGVARAGR